jgi:integrase
LGLLAGLRRGEIFGLHWQDLDWSADLIHVRRNLFYRYGKHHEVPQGESKFIIYAPKSEKSIREIDLSPALKRELRARYLQSEDKHGLIFQSSNGTPLDPHNVYERWFKPAAERASKKAAKDKDKIAADNLTGFRMHDLRHTFGSWKIAQGEDIVYVCAQMGHAKPSITADIYSHLLEKRRPHAAAQTDTILFGNAVAAGD